MRKKARASKVRNIVHHEFFIFAMARDNVGSDEILSGW
jgi:hypothetical protein